LTEVQKVLQNFLGNTCLISYSAYKFCADSMMLSSLPRTCRGVTCRCLSTAYCYQSVIAVTQDSEWGHFIQNNLLDILSLHTTDASKTTLVHLYCPYILRSAKASYCQTECI